MTFYESFFLKAVDNSRFAGDFKWKDVVAYCDEVGINCPAPNHMKIHRIKRGVYNFSHTNNVDESNPAKDLKASMENIRGNESMVKMSSEVVNDFVPISDDHFIPFGCYFDAEEIIESGDFITTYITGETGYGKTFAINNLCAKHNREIIRLNCTPETDESELIGDYILINGDMVWQDGPVLLAMKRGAILLLDEVDALDPKRGAFPLYSLLEGGGVFVKKLNLRFYPEAGFNVIATANTKGKGSENGNYVGTSTHNDAFLDRFTATLEHTYPDAFTEEKILNSVDKSGDEKFMNKLTFWAKTIRESKEGGGCEVEISTRRLVNIVKLYGIFKDRAKVVGMAIKRYDEDSVHTFMDLYLKIDSDPNEYRNEAKPVAPVAPVTSATADVYPF